MWPQILLHPNILPRHAKVAISFCDIDSRDRFLPCFSQSFADSRRGGRTAELDRNGCEALAALHTCCRYVNKATRVKNYCKCYLFSGLAGNCSADCIPDLQILFLRIPRHVGVATVRAVFNW